MKRFRVSLTVKRELVRIVKAKTEAQAIKAAKQNVCKTIPRIRMKDFDKNTYVESE